MIRNTTRLRLRPLHIGDCDRVRELAGDERVARWTRIPHPYPAGAAAKWIEGSRTMWAEGSGLVFAICRNHGQADPPLIGSIGLHDLHEGEMELGFWLAPEEWGKGLMTEALTEMVALGFEVFTELDTISACCMCPNEASARVMEKCGFRETACMTKGQRRFHLSRAPR